MKNKSFLIVLFLTILLSIGCTKARQNNEAEKIMHLIKSGDYAQVKSICHYYNSWDPDDSIFNRNVRFIHAYLDQYGYPSRRDYKNFLHKDQDNITKIYLDKAFLMDTSLDTVYVELDFYNISKDYVSDPSAKSRLFTTFAKASPPVIDNFYLIKMKKGEKY